MQRHRHGASLLGKRHFLLICAPNHVLGRASNYVLSRVAHLHSLSMGSIYGAHLCSSSVQLFCMSYLCGSYMRLFCMSYLCSSSARPTVFLTVRPACCRHRRQQKGLWPSCWQHAGNNLLATVKVQAAVEETLHVANVTRILYGLQQVDKWYIIFVYATCAIRAREK